MMFKMNVEVFVEVQYCKNFFGLISVGVMGYNVQYVNVFVVFFVVCG